MTKPDQQRTQQLLRQSLQPVSRQSSPEPRRELWPLMLARLEAPSESVPWFDWALLVAAMLLLVFSPGAIPVLLYHF